MGKLIKIVFGFIAILLVLILSAAVIVPMVVDPNDYKDEIVQKVEDSTGRKLHIGGDIGLSVFPWVGIELSNLELSNAKGFGDAPFAKIDGLSVRVKLMPLLSKQVEIDTVGLDGLALNLAKDKTGKTNWDDLNKGNVSPTEEKTSDNDTDNTSQAPTISIGGINISNTQISWNDQSTGKKITIEDVSLTTGSLQQGKPVDIDMSLLINNAEPQLKAAIHFTTTLTLDQDKGQIDLSQLILAIEASGKAVNNGTVKSILKADIQAALDASNLSMNNLDISSGSLSLTGSLNGKALNTEKPLFQGDLRLAEFNLKQWLNDFGMVLPEMSDTTVLTKVAATLALKVEGESTKINQLKIILDDSHITGSASVKGSAIGFDLNLNKINIDRYSPTASNTPAADKTVDNKASNTKQGLIPVATLRALNLNGQIKIGELLANNLKMQDILLKVNANQGIIKSQQKIGQFYQGSIDSKLDLNVTGQTPKIKLNNTIKDIHAGELMTAIAGQDKISGLANASYQLTTSGNSVDAFKQALNGQFKFNFANGAIKGFNLAKMIRDAKAKLTGKASSGEAANQTDFSALSGSGVIKNGLLSNQDFLAKSPFIRVNGSGTVNLVTETLNYLVKTVIVGTSKGQGGSELNDLKGLTIPIKVTGTFADPKPKIDFGSILQDKAKAELKAKAKEKLKDALSDKLKGDLGDSLKGSLGDKLKGFGF